MNTMLLWAVPIALVSVLALALVGWAVLRHRPRQGQRAAGAPPAKPQAPRPPLPAAQAGSVAAQHQAATEALRQARRRKADDTARQAADRAAPRPAAAATAAAVATASPRSATATAATAATPRPAVPAPAPRAAVPPTAARALPQAIPRPEPVVSVLSPLAIQLNAGRAPVVSPAAAPAGLAPLRSPPRPIWRPTVLVADDSKVVRVKTGRLLEKLGWRVLLADDGQAALRCLVDESPDLLITDVEMPGLDGFALTRQLRAEPRWARLPVIMITSSDDKHRAEANAAGVNVLLGKPYAEAELLAQAQRLLGAAMAPRAPAMH